MLDKPLSLWHCPFAQLPPCSEADFDRNTSCGKVCAELCLFLKHEGSFVCKGDNVSEHRRSDMGPGGDDRLQIECFAKHRRGEKHDGTTSA